MELIGPLSSVFAETDDSVQLPFVLRAEGTEHTIKVRARGKSRRRVCKFPPLRLNFAVKRTADSVFAGQDKLKLVTHCLDRGASQVDVLQEYAAYRMFSRLSDVSYRVRLLNIAYTDTDSTDGEKDLVRYGFVIESSSALAGRVGGQQAEVTAVSLKSLNQQHAATVFVFQYLVGNTDWSLVTAQEDDACCHNGDLIDIGADRYYVPYDFDLTGLVNPRYAKPDPSLRIQRVTQRLYRGYCISSADMRDALVAIKAQRTDILEVIERLPGLSPKDRKSTTDYLDRFFRQAEDEDKILRMFERRCI